MCICNSTLEKKFWKSEKLMGLTLLTLNKWIDAKGREVKLNCKTTRMIVSPPY